MTAIATWRTRRSPPISKPSSPARQAAGVERVLTILEAGNAKEAAQAARLQQLWPDVRFSIGVHPHQAHAFADDPGRAEALVREELTRTEAARAVGEIGLDYHYDFSPPDVQHAVFRAQVRLARELRRPVVIHTREADEDTIAILREEGGGELQGRPALLHGRSVAGARRARSRPLYLAGRHHYVSESGRPARHRPRRAARPPAD